MDKTFLEDEGDRRTIGSLWNFMSFQPLKRRIQHRIEYNISKMLKGRKEESMRELASRVDELKKLLDSVEADFSEFNRA